MHILFLTHYYPPESNAPANRVSELACAWVAAGHKVTVVTGTPNHPGGRPYPGYKNRMLQREMVGGVEVIRLWTFLAPNEGVTRRSLNYLSYLGATAVAVFRMPTPDVVISTSPQFFAGLAGAVVAWVKRRPWILEIRDIWPESVAAVGAVRRGRLLRCVECVEQWAYRRADQVVAVSHAFTPHITERGPLKRPVAIVENGVDMALFDGVDRGGDFRNLHGLEDKVVFGYIGTHGMAHALETVLRAAKLEQDNPRIGWLLVGTGAERERLLAVKEELALTNVVMLDHQPRSEMPAIWSGIDVSLVVLRRSDLFKRVIPSKMFEAMAMSRPIVLGVDGEARRIVEAGDCGVFVEPENPEALASVARTLAADSAQRTRLGSNGKTFVRLEYERGALAARYLRIITSVVGGSTRLNANAND